MLLRQTTVLLVEPDPERAASLAGELRREGARCFVAGDTAKAVWGAEETLPDAIVSELSLPDGDAHELLERLRRTPEFGDIVSLGLTSRVPLASNAPNHSGFDKYLTTPAEPRQVVEAVRCALGLRRAVDASTEFLLDGIGELVERRDYGVFLRTLNAASDYRYSAYLRPGGDALGSVWTYDRERPHQDRWPLGIATDRTPCAPVLASGLPLHVEDIRGDARIPPAQRHAIMRAFTGVPVRDEKHRVSGILCHFSPDVVPANAWVTERLELAARLFATRPKSSELG